MATARSATRGEATRARILARAAVLFARRGYHGVSTDELGAAAGITGPALYKHFATKEALLGDLLVRCSERLLEGGTARAGGSDRPPAEVLADLVDFHVAFALDEPELIVIQDRDWAHLPPADQRAVRRLQRSYVGVWTDVLRRARPGLDAEESRAAVQAVFGLMNSTPHSVGSLPRPAVAALLHRLALAALLGTPAPRP
jgi:AcrR family transcriptional regulator